MLMLLRWFWNININHKMRRFLSGCEPPPTKKPRNKENVQEASRNYVNNIRPRTFQTSWTKGRPWLIFQEDATFCSICWQNSDIPTYTYIGPCHKAHKALEKIWKNSDILVSDQFLGAGHNSSFWVLSLCKYNYRKSRATLFDPGRLRNQEYWPSWPPGTEVKF